MDTNHHRDRYPNKDANVDTYQASDEHSTANLDTDKGTHYRADRYADDDSYPSTNASSDGASG